MPRKRCEEKEQHTGEQEIKVSLKLNTASQKPQVSEKIL